VPSVFINSNHAAAFCGVAVLVALGLTAEEESTRKKWLLAGVSGTMIGGLMLTLSRGGIIAAALLTALYCVYLVAFRRSGGRTSPSGHLGAIAGTGVIIAVCGAVIWAWLSSDLVIEASTIDESAMDEKTDPWSAAPAIIRDYPFLGIGRGALEGIFTRYSAAPRAAAVHRFENEWLQLLVDIGPALAVVAMVLCAAALVGLIKRSGNKPLGMAIAAVVAFLGVHNLVDFNLSVLGVAMPAAALFSAALGRRGRPRDERSRRSSGSANRERAWLLPLCTGVGRALVLVALVAVGARLSLGRELRFGDERRVHAALDDSSLSTAERVRELKEVTARHPSDYVMKLKIARWILNNRADPRRALPWLNAALFMNPHSHDAHRLTGHALWGLGAKHQALLEYRQAADSLPYSHVPSRIWPLLREHLSRPGASKEDWATIAGYNQRARYWIALMANSGDVPAVTEKIFDSPVLQDYPRAQWLGALIALQLGNLDQAVTRARKAQAVHPQNYKAYFIEAEDHARRRAPELMAAALARGERESMSPVVILKRSIGLWRAIGDLQRAYDTATRLVERANDRASLAYGHLEVARLNEALSGDREKTLRHFKEALALAPEDVDTNVSAASFWLKMGDAERARRQLQSGTTAMRRDPQIVKFLAKLDGLQN